MAIKSLGFLLATAWFATSALGAAAQTLGALSITPDDAIASKHLPCAFGGLVTFRVNRFTFEIEPSPPLEKLLPTPPLQAPPRLAWLVKDLTEVPEILLQKPLHVPRLAPESIFLVLIPNVFLEQGAGETAAVSAELDKELNTARQQIALTLAKINFVNKAGEDRFLNMLIESREDLAGLPFLKGSACRMNKEVSRKYVDEMDGHSIKPPDRPETDQTEGAPENIPLPDAVALARVAAWMQTSPENVDKREYLVKVLGRIQHPAATLALAKLAVFAPEKVLREEAVAVLQGRPRRDYAAVLIDGLRYPWPAAASNAAEALVKLRRVDLVSHLVDFLDEREAPFDQTRDGRSVTVVRELVRLNHHHNCVTCHAPATSDPDFNKSGRSSDFMAGDVTLPYETGYSGTMQFPDLAVRADVTYLRQDFSVMQKVENGVTGNAEERFDFLVRTRELKEYEVMLYRDWLSSQTPHAVSANHQAALAALRQLTGRDAGTTAAAWRKRLALQMKAPPA